MFENGTVFNDNLKPVYGICLGEHSNNTTSAIDISYKDPFSYLHGVCLEENSNSIKSSSCASSEDPTSSFSMKRG
jgi:hypothetical protein